MGVYPTPPPSYLEVTNGKAMAEPHSQSQCHVNEAMESDTDNPNMPNSCSEAPPPYESIRTIWVGDSDSFSKNHIICCQRKNKLNYSLPN